MPDNERSQETQVLIEEAIRLGILIGMLLIARNWQWFEHQYWRLTTMRDRSKRNTRLAEQQVSKEISWMEHGQGVTSADPVAFQQP